VKNLEQGVLGLGYVLVLEWIIEPGVQKGADVERRTQNDIRANGL
jgi:hypothetical protein